MEEELDLEALEERFKEAMAGAEKGKALEEARERYEKFDESGPEAIADDLHPDFELHVETILLDGDNYRGADGLGRWREDLGKALSDDAFEPQAIRSAAEDRFAVLGRLRGKLRSSGIEIDLPMVHVYELREGKVWRQSLFDDAGEGLASIGIVD